MLATLATLVPTEPRHPSDNHRFALISSINKQRTVFSIARRPFFIQRHCNPDLLTRRLNTLPVPNINLAVYRERVRRRSLELILCRLARSTRGKRQKCFAPLSAVIRVIVFPTNISLWTILEQRHRSAVLLYFGIPLSPKNLGCPKPALDAILAHNRATRGVGRYYIFGRGPHKTSGRRLQFLVFEEWLMKTYSEHLWSRRGVEVPSPFLWKKPSALALSKKFFQFFDMLFIVLSY